MKMGNNNNWGEKNFFREVTKPPVSVFKSSSRCFPRGSLSVFFSFFFLSPISGLSTPHRLLCPMRRGGGGEGRKDRGGGTPARGSDCAVQSSGK